MNSTQRLADIREDIAREAPAWLSPVTVADTRWLLAELDRTNARLALAERVAEAALSLRTRHDEEWDLNKWDAVDSEATAALDAWEAGKDGKQT